MSAPTYNQPIPFRAPSITLNQLQDLRNKWGENRSQVIIRCIERIWQEELAGQTASDTMMDREEDQVEATA